ncbi:MAG: rhodanese-like domain-containing protein [Bacteroidota bacterium]|nr:rhodanese-like domain-containing protein [Bacteroidota bacterium]
MKIINFILLNIFVLLGLVACSNTVLKGNENALTLIDTSKTIIVDVRTVQEWNQDGHANCSVNYPLNELESKVSQLKAYSKIILVCRSGSRANSAKIILEKAGLKNIENKGPWQNINCNN